MNCLRYAVIAGAACAAALAQSTTPDVGSGSPNVLIQQQFQLAYYRNGFANQVAYPPLGDVKRLGTNGLVQEFSDAAKSTGVKLALVMPNASAPIVQGVTPVFQMQAGLYSYFSQVGVNTAGMPTTDTANCPMLQTSNSCQYQLFDKPYALFVYKTVVNNGGTDLFTRDPYYTKWIALGGIAAMGPATSPETAVTSTGGTKATAQYFDRGALYNITSGTNSGRLLAVRAPTYSLFASSNLDQGFLGVPTSDELVLANGHIRQSFEGGAIEYDPANPSNPPVLRNPVTSIVVAAPGSTIRLKLGDTVGLQATVSDINGAALADRQILWSTSNGRVVSVQPNGAAATVKAVGGGTATVNASSEGKSSAPITFIVTSPCCQIGEGAPTAAIAQAFQDALNRNRLSVQLPAAGAVTRVGAGYLQQFEAAGTSGAAYLVAVPDSALTGFVVGGKLLARYQSLGGPAGTLGYPLSDATPQGRQMFENGALAGDPVQVVTGDILAKWGVLGYESGPAGNPTAAPVDGLTFKGTPVHSQAFQNALLAAVTSGRTVKVYAVTGLVLAMYASLGGPGGRMGAPLADEAGIDNRRRQDFEGGFIDYAPGDAVASVHENPRQPVVTAAPGAVLAGSRIRLAAGGFDDGATVRVSITGQPDFTVMVANGAYIWENYIPANAASATIVVRAVDAGNPAKTAQVSYSIRALADARLQLTVARGDTQTGAPGALLPAPMVVVLTDDTGAPVAGSPVTFAASPGAKIESASAVTNANGEASAMLRLPASEGVALVTATAARDIATFSARALHTSLANFPQLSEKVSGTLADSPFPIADQGAMLTAVASIVRYYQARGEAPSPNGLADPVALNQFLKASCGLDAKGVQICDGFVRAGDRPEPLVNLWRAAGFAGNALDVSVGTGGVPEIRDYSGQGVPVLTALALASGAAHFVVATGIAADGSILIMDPDPASGRSTLDQYLASGARVTGTAVFLPRPARSGGFLVVANARVSAASAGGSCGASFEIARPGGDNVQFRYCEGTAARYEVDLDGPAYKGQLIGLGPLVSSSDLGGSGPSSYKVGRAGQVWTVDPLDIAIADGGILNAASFTDAIAPGGLASIFGAGFGTDPKAITVDFGGVRGTVIAAFPFQLNVQVPPGLPPGQVEARVASSAGMARRNIVLSPTAPALFTLGGSQGAILNGNNSINGASNPARRGEAVAVFGTGFGAVTAAGGLQRTQVPVTASIGGVSVPILFSGLAPGFLGLYQINVGLPTALPPGLALPFTVQQGISASNTVQIAVQ